MNEISIFESSEFGKIRTISRNGEPWFVGKDVAEALGYTNSPKALRDHCKGVNETRTPTKGGVQTVKIIPESDLYRLIIRSHLPAAEKFSDWICEEVLPSIRKTGSYTHHSNLMSDMDAFRYKISKDPLRVSVTTKIKHIAEDFFGGEQHKIWIKVYDLFMEKSGINIYQYANDNKFRVIEAIEYLDKLEALLHTVDDFYYDLLNGNVTL